MKIFNFQGLQENNPSADGVIIPRLGDDVK